MERSQLHLRLGAIALGGAVGTTARVELGRLLPAGPGFPWGTFTVNIAGCFLLGLGAALVLERLAPARLVWPLFATGFCGSFTTFSTLAVDADLRLRSGDVVVGLAYAAVSVVLGVVAVVAGGAVGRGLPGRKAGGDWADTVARRRPWT